ncbi:hypothetical protein [Antarcticirhabdus aurantiaca]|uniref:Uncharacterized protein n=1 Tax=Antarcticirhabdus aurantiaca TaxID=2606717 RepID=A0ACD4NR21_9HYPH|nr:hypothetical protein [Antarcticirhabdus aurantiaca]WAJ29288.1 hypothetical protein OXU80_03365 [Jeongeuplla avenae]
MAKELWLSALAALLAFAPAQAAWAQTAAPAAQAADDDDGDDAAPAADDDDGDDDDDAGAASHRGAMVPPASGLTIPPGSELMPASALNGDQIGLPPVSLSSQIVTPLVIGSDDDPYAISAKDFYLRAGQAYRWDMVSEGNVEYKLHAPDFFRNVWMNQIVISDREIHMAGPPAWLEYDAKGPITVQFQTIRPGRYDWYVEGLEGDREMRGTITVVP